MPRGRPKGSGKEKKEEVSADQAIAGSLRAMADYIESEAAARIKLLEDMKGMRLQYMKAKGAAGSSEEE